MSQPSFTQISAGRGGSRASAGLTYQLHVCFLHVDPQRGTPELEAPPSLFPVNPQQQPRPRPAPASGSWAGPQPRAKLEEPTGGEMGTRVARATWGAELIQ